MIGYEWITRPTWSSTDVVELSRGFNTALSLGIAERGVLGATRGATLLH